jgi:hypothetical protein
VVRVALLSHPAMGPGEGADRIARIRRPSSTKDSIYHLVVSRNYFCLRATHFPINTLNR